MQVGGKVSIETGMVSIPAQLHLNMYSKDSNHLVEGVSHESRDQTIQLSRQRSGSSEEALQHAFGRRAYMDKAYYVGFRVGDQEIGLDPQGHNQGMTGPVGYFPVSDIQKSLQSL